MAVLAIDTALNACSAAIARDGEVLAGRFTETSAGQAELLLPMIAEVLAAAGLTPRSLTKIGVTRGPGSFTGARIGLAAARAMGRALDLPVIGLTSFEALICGAPAHTPLIAALDARNDQIYLQAFAADHTPLSVMQALSLADAPGHLPAFTAPPILMGTAAPELAHVLTAAHMAFAEVGPQRFPDAAQFVREVARRHGATDDMPRPIYLRTDAVSTALGEAGAQRVPRGARADLG